jgi:hypothetical protein
MARKARKNKRISSKTKIMGSPSNKAALKRRLSSDSLSPFERAQIGLQYFLNKGPRCRQEGAFVLCQRALIESLESTRIADWDAATAELCQEALQANLIFPYQFEILRMMDAIRLGRLAQYKLPNKLGEPNQTILKAALRILKSKENIDPTAFRRGIKAQLTKVEKSADTVSVLADLFRLYLSFKNDTKKPRITKSLRQASAGNSELALASYFLSGQQRSLSTHSCDDWFTARGKFLRWISGHELPSRREWRNLHVFQGVNPVDYADQYAQSVVDKLELTSRFSQQSSPDETLRSLMLNSETEGAELYAFSINFDSYLQAHRRALEPSFIIWALPRLVALINQALKNSDFHRSCTLARITMLVLKVSQRAAIRKELPQGWNLSSLCRHVCELYESGAVLTSHPHSTAVLGQLLSRFQGEPEQRHEALFIAQQICASLESDVDSDDKASHKAWTQAHWYLVDHGPKDEVDGHLITLVSQDSSSEADLTRAQKATDNSLLSCHLELTFCYREGREEQLVKTLINYLKERELVSTVVNFLSLHILENAIKGRTIAWVKGHPFVSFMQQRLPIRSNRLTKKQIRRCLKAISTGETLTGLHPNDLILLLYALENYEDSNKLAIDFINLMRPDLGTYLDSQAALEDAPFRLLFAISALLEDGEREQKYLRALRRSIAANRAQPQHYCALLLRTLGIIEFLMRIQKHRRRQYRKWKGSFHKGFYQIELATRQSVLREFIDVDSGIYRYLYTLNYAGALLEHVELYSKDIAVLIFLSQHSLLVLYNPNEATDYFGLATSLAKTNNDSSWSAQFELLSQLIEAHLQLIGRRAGLRSMLDELFEDESFDEEDFDEEDFEDESFDEEDFDEEDFDEEDFDEELYYL